MCVRWWWQPSLFVRAELPQRLPSVKTKEVRLLDSKKQIDFGYFGEVDVSPGSPQQGALAAALSTTYGEEDGEVEFILMSAGVTGGEREREVGSAIVDLRELLRTGATDLEQVRRSLPRSRPFCSPRSALHLTPVRPASSRWPSRCARARRRRRSARSR